MGNVCAARTGQRNIGYLLRFISCWLLRHCVCLESMLALEIPGTPSLRNAGLCSCRLPLSILACCALLRGCCHYMLGITPYQMPRQPFLKT